MPCDIWRIGDDIGMLQQGWNVADFFVKDAWIKPCTWLSWKKTHFPVFSGFPNALDLVFQQYRVPEMAQNHPTTIWKTGKEHAKMWLNIPPNDNFVFVLYCWIWFWFLCIIQGMKTLLLVYNIFVKFRGNIRCLWNKI